MKNLSFLKQGLITLPIYLVALVLLVSDSFGHALFIYVSLLLISNCFFIDPTRNQKIWKRLDSWFWPVMRAILVGCLLWGILSLIICLGAALIYSDDALCYRILHYSLCSVIAVYVFVFISGLVLSFNEFIRERSIKKQAKLLLLAGAAIAIVASMFAKKHPPYTAEPMITFFTKTVNIIKKNLEAEPGGFEEYLEKIYLCQSWDEGNSEPFYICGCRAFKGCRCGPKIRSTPICRTLIAYAYLIYDYDEKISAEAESEIKEKYKKIIEGKLHPEGAFLIFEDSIDAEIVERGIPLRNVLIVASALFLVGLYCYVRAKKLDQKLIKLYAMLSSEATNQGKSSIILWSIVPILVKQREYEEAFEWVNRAKELGMNIEECENRRKWIWGIIKESKGGFWNSRN